MKANEAFAKFIGMFQSLIGILSISLAYFIHSNPDLLPIRTWLNLQLEHVPFYMMILFILGFFAIISGLLIIREWSTGQ